MESDNVEYLSKEQKIRDQLAEIEIPDALIDKMIRRYMDIKRLPQIAIDLERNKIFLIDPEGGPSLEFDFTPIDGHDDEYDADVAQIVSEM